MGDLRAPIGWFFLLLGMILTITGGAPVNYYSGASMLVFGAGMAWLGRRRSA